MRQATVVFCFMAGSLAAAFCAATSCTAAERPNIVFILADDLGWGSVGCYGADPKLVRTPNIDRLAREGRRFTDANTPSSVCSPTRYGVVTGRYCWRTSLQCEVLGVFDPLHIETDRLTVASLAKRQGYQTAAIGKWHLGYGSTKPVDYTAKLRPGPQDIGFDFHFGVPSNHGDVTGVFTDCEGVIGLRSKELKQFGASYYGKAPFLGLDAPQREDERVMDQLTDQAIAWIDKQDRQKPFFLYFTPVAIHEPSTPSAKTKGTSGCGPYGDWTHELDNSVGRILETLERKKLAQNTLVIFTADNGGVLLTEGNRPEAIAYAAGLRVSGPWRGRKHSIFEGGFRVPFVARWPGKIPAGTVCDETISLVDTLATMAALFGEPLPPAATAAEDSHNVLPAILGQKYDRPLRPDLIVHSADGVFAIRKGPWKWIEGDPAKSSPPKSRIDEFKPQLYNLITNPAETKDVSGEHPEIVKELSTLLERYRAGGYSREVPQAAVKAAPIVLPPLGEKTVLNLPLAELPEAPWVQVRGKWSAKDGAIWGVAKPVDRADAAYRCPLAQTDGDIRYELFVRHLGSHAMRVQCAGNATHYFMIEFSSRGVTVTRPRTDADRPGQSLAIGKAAGRLSQGQWREVRVSFRGNDLYVAVGDATLKTTHPFFGEPKAAFAFLAGGDGAGFRKLTVTKKE